jgi:transposase
MIYTHMVGIDVSKEKLDYAVLQGKQILFQHQSSNDPQGIKAFIKLLTKQLGFSIEHTLFCMEHTGIYNQFVLQNLHTLKANVCLESSLQIKLSLGLQRGKNDRLDAVRIAQYAYKNREELRLWQPKREVVEQLHHFTTLRYQLLQARKQLNAALKEQMLFNKKLAKQLTQTCKRTMAALDKDLEKVDQQIEQIIASDNELKRLFSIITSVQGVGNVTAAEIIITTNEFKNIDDPSKFACYSGVAPFEHTSGSSIRGKTRVSHKANKYMKTLLHMAAMVAIQFNDDLKAYYQRKSLENKNKMSIINAVRNKLIWRIFACVKQNRGYQNKYLTTLV